MAFIIFGTRTRRIGRKLGASTFADLLGKVYKSRNIRMFTALLIIIMMPIYCAAVLKGGVNSLAVITGLDYDAMLIVLSIIVALYVVYGGIIAVMYNDALQAVVMFVGMVVIFVVTIATVGLDGFEDVPGGFGFRGTESQEHTVGGVHLLIGIGGLRDTVGVNKEGITGL